MRKFGLIALLAIVCLGQDVQAQTFTLENVASIDTAADGITAQRWNWLGTKIAYITSPGTNNTLYVIEPNNTVNKTLLAGSSEMVLSGSSIAWSPDSSSVLFSTNKFASGGLYKAVISKVSVATQIVTDHILDPDDLGFTNANHRLHDPYVVNRSGTYYLVVAVIEAATPIVGKGIWAVQIDATGTPTGTPVKVVDGAFGLLRRPSYSPKSNRLYVEQPWTSTERRLWTVLGANDIVDGSTSAVTSAGDSRVHSVTNTTNTHFKMDPQPSEDGWFIYWTEDVSGTYNETNSATFATANFEIMVDNILNISIDTWNSQTLARADNQGTISASPAGTRMCFAEGGSLVPGAATLFACSVGITHSVPTNDGADPGTVVTAATVDGYDGSGSFFAVPAGTVVTLPVKSADFTVQITTPLSVGTEIQTSVAGVAVRRDFTPSGTTFVPAASLRLAYTDVEVQGLDEATLAVYVVAAPVVVKSLTKVIRVDGSKAIGVKAMGDLEAAPVLERDTANNTLTIAVSHFSSFLLAPPQAVVQDADGDGLSDADENTYGTNPNVVDTDGDGRSDYQEVWYDGSGAYNPYIPTTNPTGTDTNANNADTDGDGVDDWHDVGPLDPGNATSLPAASPASLAFLAVILLFAGAYVARQKLVKKA